MRDSKTRAPHTAHKCNHVPFILAGNKADGYALVRDEEKKSNDGDEDEEEGVLCDVAPTELDLMVRHLTGCCFCQERWMLTIVLQGLSKLEGASALYSFSFSFVLSYS
jgi:hypothetical protein